MQATFGNGMNEVRRAGKRENLMDKGILRCLRILGRGKKGGHDVALGIMKPQCGSALG